MPLRTGHCTPLLKTAEALLSQLNNNDKHSTSETVKVLDGAI
jgi:hypothetical protein